MSTQFRSDHVRLILFLKRKPGLSKEEFSHYWSDTHAPLFLSLDIVKRNVIKYEQAHAHDKYIAAREALGVPSSDWDGLVILDGESYDKLFEIFTSEEYARIVAPDEGNFIDRPKCQLMALDLVTVFE